MPEMIPWEFKGEHSGKVLLQLFTRLDKLSKEEQRAGVKTLGLHFKHHLKWQRAIRDVLGKSADAIKSFSQLQVLQDTNPEQYEHLTKAAGIPEDVRLMLETLHMADLAT